MNVKEYLDKVAYVGKILNGDVYCSKFDGSYITHVGMEDDVKFLADREITEELTHGVGFSPKENKWYGWSHRAIYGFTVGSTCKKGDAHYVPPTIEDQKEDAVRFWSDKYHENVRCEGVIERTDGKYFDIRWEYTDDVPNEKCRGQTSGHLVHIGELGRGEWIAETMADARQMAIDFNESVS